MQVYNGQGEESEGSEPLMVEPPNKEGEVVREGIPCAHDT